MGVQIMLISVTQSTMIPRHRVTPKGVDSEDVIMEDKRQDDTDTSKLKRVREKEVIAGAAFGFFRTL
jgi:hypothetical protein